MSFFVEVMIGYSNAYIIIHNNNLHYLFSQHYDGFPISVSNELQFYFIF